jgi:lipopolysaccharide/colanic/teichoic acid biosynthesis glycosyltransferase
LVAVATAMAYLLRENFDIVPEKMQAFVPYMAGTLATACIIVPALGLSRSLWRFSSMTDYLHLLAASLAITLGAVAISFAFNRLDGVARSIPVLQPMMLLLLLAGARVFMRIRHMNRGRSARQFATASGADPLRRPTVLVVGLNRLTELYLQSVHELSTGEISIAGLVGRDQRQKGRLMHRYPVLGTPEELEQIVNDLRVHGIFVGRIVIAVKMAGLSPEARAALDKISSGSDIVIEFLAASLGLEDVETQSAPASGMDDSGMAPRDGVPPETLLAISDNERAQLERRAYWGVKRAADIMAAVALLTLVGPLMLVLAALVFFDMGRPVLFWQQRPGLGGRPFRLYKFRTMGAAYDDAGRHLADDQRVGALGRFLRRSRLDELPQLFNVLVGQMSFIGPRPLLPVDQPVGSAARLQVRPGLTGWAQVKGGRYLSALDKVALDVWYVRNASLAVDLEIIARTVVMVIFGERENRDAVRHAWEDVHDAHARAVCAEMAPVPASGGSGGKLAA